MSFRGLGFKGLGFRFERPIGPGFFNVLTRGFEFHGPGLRV